MQFFSLCLIAILFGCSSVLSAPVHDVTDGLPESQHQKIVVGVHRLLKELTNEQRSDGKSHTRKENDKADYLPTTNDVDRSISFADAVDADGTSLGDGKDLMKFLQELRYFDGGYKPERHKKQ